MQNRNNIDERLQILNDYIQRTIDALNVTRQVAQNLTSSYQQNLQPVFTGISHSHLGYGLPQLAQQFVQTPYGLMPINVQNGFNYGLNHAAFVPQHLAQQIAPQWQANYVPFGVPQVAWTHNVAQWPQTVQPFGFNHSPYAAQQQMWPTNYLTQIPQVGFAPVAGFTPTNSTAQLDRNQAQTKIGQTAI
jgi:hypothetical protein